MSEITWPNKNTGDFMTASEMNEVKASVNELYTAFLNYYDISSGAVTTISEQNTWYKLNSTTVEGYSYDGLTHSNNRVTWTGANTSVFSVQVVASLISGNSQELHIAFFKNGQLVAQSEQPSTTSSSGKASSIATQSYVELATNDYVEVWVKNVTSATNITLFRLNATIRRLAQ